MKKTVLIIMSILIVISMAGCGGCSADDRTETIENGRSIYSVDILKQKDMMYDANTRIVYISQYTYNGNRIYTLYLSENGFPYRYVDGKLVEVGQ